MGYKLNGSIKFPDLRFLNAFILPFLKGIYVHCTSLVKCKYFISALVELEVTLETNTPLAITK